MKKDNVISLSIFIFSLFGIFQFYGCGGESDHIPKPRGYFRIHLPEKEYLSMDTVFPYSFDYPVYADILPYSHGNSTQPYWIDISFPSFQGSIHISYFQLENNLATYLEDCHTFINKHIPLATAIREKNIQNHESKVFGTVFRIDGSQTASPLQFYATDSTNHFIRGALYFMAVPNNDSLAPVIDYISEDIDRFLHSLQWKDL